jgi:putative SOS response-associated peptidase YedK
MCGRFTLVADPDLVQATFALDSVPAGLAPRYNIAPSQPVLALTNEGGRDAELLRWGLIPAWAREASIGDRMINARAETLAEKSSFRNAFKRRRCAIFADGFYEWKKPEGPGPKIPLYIRLREGQPFAMAGLWEVWKDKTADTWIRSCTIVTTSPNGFMAPIHNRMPVILDGPALDRWLTPGDMAPGDLMPLLRPYEDEAAFSAYPVSRLVNSPDHDVPECIAPQPQPGALL